MTNFWESGTEDDSLWMPVAQPFKQKLHMFRMCS
jgi:hypothetical protein